MSRPALGTIVVAVDGLSGGDDALALARHVATPATTVALVHVVTGDAAHDVARSVLHAARERFGAPAITVVRAATSVGAGLRAAASELGADAIISGAPEPRPVGAPPADLSGILHHAPCAIAVAPRGERERGREVTRIGVAYRQTPSGEAALSLGRALASDLGATVHTMTVVPLLPSPWLGPTLAGAEAAGRLGGESAALAEAHLASLPDVVGQVAAGDPAAQLTRFSRTVDLLIVGSSRHGTVRRLLLGSTAEVLLTASACPVLVVPGRAVGAPRQAAGSTAEPTGLTSR